MKNSAKVKLVKDIFSWIVIFALTVLFIHSVFTVSEARKNDEMAFLFGHCPAVVLTGSMEPYMLTNSVCIVREVTDIDELEVGDVITFRVDDGTGYRPLITHRIHSIDGEYITTKGDNNKVTDGTPITMENVEAEVVVVFNQFAWLVEKWQTAAGKVMIVSFGVGIILLICVASLIFPRNKYEDTAEQKVVISECEEQNTEYESISNEENDSGSTVF